MANREQNLIEMKLLATWTDGARFVSCLRSVCSQFMTETQLENLRLIYLHFFIDVVLFTPAKVEFFCVANIRNQSKFQNLFPVNSLNNLHHKARLTHCSDFL